MLALRCSRPLHVAARAIRPPSRCATTPAESRPWTAARVAGYAVAAPYALLLGIPVTSTALAAYHAARGHEESARGCAFFAVTGYLSLPFSVPMLLAAPYTLLLDADQRTYPDAVQRAWATATTNCFFATKVEGAEKLAAVKGPAVYASNHASWLDIYAMSHVPSPPLKIVAKREIFLIPLCGWVMSLIGHVPYDRSKGGGPVLDACVDLVDRGVSVLFFPEGTRTKDGALRPFKPGAFVVAARTGAPVVPVSIRNTRYLMPPGDEFWSGGFLRTGRDVEIVVHDPVYPSSAKGVDVVADLEKRVKAAIASAL